MATNKPNPNLSQAQYLALAARVNAATGYQAQHALCEKRKPKETAALITARKLIKDHDAKVQSVSNAVKAELEIAKNTAMDSVLFGTADKAVTAVKTLEGKYRV